MHFRAFQYPTPTLARRRFRSTKDHQPVTWGPHEMRTLTKACGRAIDTEKRSGTCLELRVSWGTE
ncbi:hypothetical protein Sjap_013752 [Stephania japonica]|uniref:Uncharacterized protein n=1 Tax=Stephania japonica TaxID=461633 RepID=A0AAP0P0A1_9MAGN